MTITNTRPAQPGLPEPEKRKKLEGFQLQIAQIIKNLSNVANANQTLRRHLLISQEHLSQDAERGKKEILAKSEEILNHQDEISDQIAEGFAGVANELHTMSGNESQSLNCIYARLGVISEQLGVLIKRGS